MNNRLAFTMIELIFVIVIMGIIGKFGVEYLAQAYKSFLYTKVSHTLQSKSEIAVEEIAARLQYRIKDSVIARKESKAFVPIASSNVDDSYTILEWVGSDSDGFRGDTEPFWSGIIDLNQSSATLLKSPKTDTDKVDSLIQALGGTSFADDVAIYFIGSNSDVYTDYGWDENITINTQSAAMHPIRKGSTVDTFVPINGDTGADNTFAGTDVFEYYKLAWTAYAVRYDATTSNLLLYYAYQPWKGESYTDGKSTILMENVSTFKFMAIGSIIKIQVCTKSDILQKDGGDYSLCKEKTIL